MHEHLSGDKFRRSQINPVFIKLIDELPPKSDVLLFCRESRHLQKNNGNLDNQVKDCSEQIISRGHNLLDFCTAVCSGQQPQEYLPEVVQKAKTLKAAIVIETIDRLGRPEGYDSRTNPNAQLGKFDWMKIEKILDGEIVHVLHNPNNSPGENRAVQTKRGMKQKEKMGGNSYKGTKSFRTKWLSIVLKLHEQGKSSRQISAELEKISGKKVTHRTILKWIKRKN